MVEKIPLQLREAHQWLVANQDAVPLSVQTGRATDPTNPLSWSTFEQAVATGAPYLGFCLSHSDPYTIIDLDDKVDKPATDEQRQFFQQLIEAFGSYTEVSRSGRGYHIVVKGRLPVGRRSDKNRIEVYSADRYFIMTGNVLPGYETIVDGQKGLDWLLTNVLDKTIPGHKAYELDKCTDQPDSDQDLLNKMCSASNSEKTIGLWQGNWEQLGYPSQSEADMALMDILCHYSPNDEQCRRMFRFSALGQRDKAKRNAYLDYMLRKKRIEQIPVDFSKLLPLQSPKSAVEVPLQQTYNDSIDMDEVPAPISKETTQGQVEYNFAPGALGWLQWYSYCSAERPVMDISLAASIGFLAGIMGRAYNCMGTGLNQYVLLLGPTGTGKDELAKLPERLMNQVSDAIPSIRDFRGPGTFASGQALIKHLCKHPCFSSVLGEFGHTIKELSDPGAMGAQLMLRKTLLLLYSSSGSEGSLQPMAYSDADKTTSEVKAPSLTIVCETVPESFFAAMSNEQVENGLLPRFLTIDYRGPRPPANVNSGMRMPLEMRNWLIELASICLSQSQRGVAINVVMDEQALQLLGKKCQFDIWCDSQINNTSGEIEKQLWNRAHLKALRLAALVAASSNPHQPVITREYAEWAISLVTKDIKSMLGRFEEGVGEGDAKQLNDLRRCLWQYREMQPEQLMASYRISDAVARSGMIPFVYIQRKLANVTSFRKCPQGASVAITRALQTLISTGEIAQAPRDRCLAVGYSGNMYIGNFGG
jgi:hypothetical protein